MVAFDSSMTGAVREFLYGLRHNAKSIILEPVNQGPQRGIFLIFEDGSVIQGTHQHALALEQRQKASEVDLNFPSTQTPEPSYRKGGAIEFTLVNCIRVTGWMSNSMGQFSGEPGGALHRNMSFRRDVIVRPWSFRTVTATERAGKRASRKNSDSV
jgi:hypothetical protein